MQKRGLMVLVAVGGILSAWSLPAYGEFTKLVTNFDGTYSYAVNLPECEVIFRNPANASTTVMFINTTAPTDSNVSNSAAGKVFSGTQYARAYWQWQDSTQHRAYVRLQTTSTVDIPNPALHLGGKVRFKIAGTAYNQMGPGRVEISGARVFLGAGIRETGISVAQGANGGISGDIEWVDVDKLIEYLRGPNLTCNTTAVAVGSDDVLANTTGLPYTDDVVCISAGPDHIMQTVRVADDVLTVTPKGNISVPLNGKLGPWQDVEFDLAALQAAGKVYSFNGNGTLDVATKIRGTLEHLAITNDPANAAINANAIMLWIEDVTFVSPIPDPPSIQTSPIPLPLETSVTINGVDSTATLLELYIQGRGGDPDYLLGSIANPGTTSWTFSPTLLPLPYGVDIYAKQLVSNLWSDKSVPVKISSPGNSAVEMAMAVRETDSWDHAMNCGDNGRGYDPGGTGVIEWIQSTGHAVGCAWGTPGGGRRIAPALGWRQIIFNPCTDPVASFSGNGAITINPTGWTNGVWEGLYFRIDSLTPGPGPYTVYIDDIGVTTNGLDYCLIDDFESYTPARYVVEGTTAGEPPVGTPDTVPEPTSDDVLVAGPVTTPGEIIIAPGPDGILQTVPVSGEFVSALRARFNTQGGTGVGTAPVGPSYTEILAGENNTPGGAQSLKLAWTFTSATDPCSHLRLTSDNYLQNAPVTAYRAPDSVVPLSLDGTLCDGSGDIAYSIMMKIEPNPIMGDWDDDGDIDLKDFAAFQDCWGATTGDLDPCDMKFDYYKNNNVNAEDVVMFDLSVMGPT